MLLRFLEVIQRRRRVSRNLSAKLRGKLGWSSPLSGKEKSETLIAELCSDSSPSPYESAVDELIVAKDEELCSDAVGEEWRISSPPLSFLYRMHKDTKIEMISFFKYQKKLTKLKMKVDEHEEKQTCKQFFLFICTSIC